jgi:LytR cell envelope-related transcriptional attenuator
MTGVLEESYTSRRRRSTSAGQKSRRERLRRDRRRRWGVVVVATLSGVVATLSSAPTSAPAQSTRTTSTTTAPSVDGRFSTFFLGHRSTDGTLDLAVLFGVDTTEPRRVSALLLPPPTMVQVAALQQQTLGELPALVDDEVLISVIENATGVRIDSSIIADDVQLAKLLEPADPIPVDFARGIRIDDAAGTLGFAGGPQRLASPDAFRVLLGDEPDGTLSHMVTVGAVLEGWLHRLGSPRVARPTVAVDARAKILRTMGGLEPRWWTLPVERVDAGDEERFRMLREDVSTLVAGQFGPATLRDGRRPKVELRNGTGTVGLTQIVSTFVIPIGIEVVHTENVVGFGVATTTVVYYRTDDKEAAEDVVEAMGVGEAVQVKEQIDFVDLTVIVGSDFEAAHPEVFGR